MPKNNNLTLVNVYTSMYNYIHKQGANMVTKTADIHVRIQPNLKEEAEKIFMSTGHTASDAITQFYAWTVRHKKTPMRLRRKPAIPCLDDMTEEEINIMVEEARQQARAGKIVSLDETVRKIEKKYDIDLHSQPDRKGRRRL